MAVEDSWSQQIAYRRATSPALRFHGDGGPFLRSCPPLAVVDSRSQQIAYGPLHQPLGSTVTAYLLSAAAPSGHAEFEVAAYCLRATSPALRFHGDGGPFLRSCPPMAVEDSWSQQIAYGSTVEVDFYSAASPFHSGRGGFEVGAGRLRAMSPALRFHGDGGLFDRSCPSDRGGFEVGAGRLRATSPALRFHGDGGCFSPQLPPLTVVDLRSEQVA
ncbi:hypothetical protein V5799_030948 [Amblyomma americanum]|uniref:Uncharacterized protein n=1 Tax=Amblyomma americanum TaxID=6943 RepID=A0AAQ4EM73_AMBAM